MHAVHAVTRVQKLVQQLPRDVMMRLQSVHRRTYGLAVGLDQIRRGLAMRFVLNVLRKQFGTVLNMRCFLHTGCGRRHKA